MKNHSVGIILFRKTSKGINFLLVKHRQGHWGFPKGHREKGERKIDTAKRELEEETGIKKPVLFNNKVLFTESYKIKKNGGVVTKRVDYYIASTDNRNIKYDGKEIINAKWFTLNKSAEKIKFLNTIRILKKAHKIITEGSK